MQLFYTAQIEGEYAHFVETEARHIVQVLRKRMGDSLQFVDGKGGWYRGIIVETGKRSCVLKVTNIQENYKPLPVHLHLAIAPTKNIDRLEWCLEKATEIGCSEITPLLCHHSERRRLREDRLQKVLIAAMKQSLKAFLPKLNPLTKLTDFLGEQDAHSQRFIAHCADDSEKQSLKYNYKSGTDVCILVGPEGDFSDEEIRQALRQGFRPVSLGNSRLRTETAGIAAVHTINLLNE